MAKRKIDLSTQDRSMTAILTQTNGKIKACKKPSEVQQVVEEAFRAAELDTPATQRMIRNLQKARSLTKAFEIVYNSILDGSGLSTQLD